MKYFYDKENRKIFVIEKNESMKLLEDNFPSEPKVSPNKSKICYISPNEWECIAKLFLFNLISGEKVTLINPQQDELVPKAAEWVSDYEIAILMGNAYGTVSVGGNVMLYDLATNTTKFITDYSPAVQVTSIKMINAKQMLLKGIEYIDKNFMESITFKQTISITD